MEQRNVQAALLEALRRCGYTLTPVGGARLDADPLASKCTACCVGEKALQTLLELASERRDGSALYHFVLESIEKPLIEDILTKTGGNQLAAARLLGINRNTLRARMKALGIRAERL